MFVHALPDSRVAAGRLRDGVSVDTRLNKDLKYNPPEVSVCSDRILALSSFASTRNVKANRAVDTIGIILIFLRFTMLPVSRHKPE
jgi:hypothetical protein